MPPAGWIHCFYFDSEKPITIKLQMAIFGGPGFLDGPYSSTARNWRVVTARRRAPIWAMLFITVSAASG